MKYNRKTAVATPTVTTHQGGQGYELKPELALMALLANGISNTYYEKETEQDKRLVDLINKVASKDLDLTIKMLVYTRATIGQRSVTHRAAVALLPHLSGTEYGKHVFTKRERNSNFGGLVYRVDDMLEIAACYITLNPGKKLPNSMVKGFKQALETADAYELAKYQGTGKEVTLVDLVNLVHPKPSKVMAKTFKQLMSGELKQFNTAEDKNTKSGQDVAKLVEAGELTESEGQEVLKTAKADNFKGLLDEKQLGYLALLRNLRNISKVADKATLGEALLQLVDEDMIKKSLVFPHQIDLALEILLAEGSVSRELIVALNEAYELAIPNLSELGAHGDTAVVYDSSGSMTTKVKVGQGKQGSASALEKAALIAATLAKGLKADVYTFANQCAEVRYNPNDSVNTLKRNFIAASRGGGTSFGSIFTGLRKRYDRVFIISDEQGADTVRQAQVDYAKRHGAPYIYCINLCGYGTTMFKPNDKVFQVFGYSAEVYETIKRFEVNYDALLAEVRKINYLSRQLSIPKSHVATKKEKTKVASKKTRSVKA